VSQSPPRQLVKKRRTILEDDDLFAFRRVDPDALSRRESNAFVQKVLDAHRFRFTLLDHQYEAARCVAGLPYLWPRTLVNDRADDTLEQAPLTADRHLILADQMGLGKTVTALAGAVLRRAVAAFHSRHAPKAVLVITCVEINQCVGCISRR
jgi:SNF2 family DNA or RNA helicase